MSSGLYITIVYGSAQLSLAFILGIITYISMKNAGEKFKCHKFLSRFWKMRGIYMPVIVHIYDTATDVGVLYEWYILMQKEKKGQTFDSLDMITFFWIAMGFMIAYRAMMGLIGGLNASIFMSESETYQNINSISLQIGVGFLSFLVGFLLGALEVGIFIGMFADQYILTQTAQNKTLQQLQAITKIKPNVVQSNPTTQQTTTTRSRTTLTPTVVRKGGKAIVLNPPIYKSAGPFQKMSQFFETIFESFPEVIMQSVFVMRSINDPILNDSNDDIAILIFISIFASILSITTKYIWIDEMMVISNCTHLIVSKAGIIFDKIYDEMHDHSEMEFDKILNVFSNSCQLYGIMTQILINHCDIKDSLNNNSTIDWSNIIITDKMVIDTCMLLRQLSPIADGNDEEKFGELNLTTINQQLTCARSLIQTNSIVNCIKQNKYSWVFNVDTCRHKQKSHAKQVLVSYGFIIRCLWRFCAVAARFAILSLVWVVLSGYWLLILAPVSTLFWCVFMIWHFVIACPEGFLKDVNIANESQMFDCRCERMLKTVLHKFCQLIEALICVSCCLCFVFELVGMINQLGWYGITGITLCSTSY